MYRCIYGKTIGKLPTIRLIAVQIAGFNHEIYGLQHVLSTKYENICD